MKIAIVHDAVCTSDAPDARDVLDQAEAVARALTSLGHRVDTLSCSPDLEKLRQRLGDLGSEAVFNLVESLEGRGSLIHLIPFFLDAVGIPYTGAPADAIMATSNKVNAKSIMASGGLPTPQWTGPFPPGPGNRSPGQDCQGPWIVKSVWEHASIGLDASGLMVDPSPGDLTAILRRRAPGPGGACFAERFIEGREFNISLLAGPHGPELMPPAEIVFEGYEPDTPRIVDYSAKWDDSSYAFHHTPRRFDFGPEDGDLIREVGGLALDCWRLFGLSGYARVDFRIDETGRPWILEVNTNPCLSPDAGFAAALERANLPFELAVKRILMDMQRRVTLNEGP